MNPHKTELISFGYRFNLQNLAALPGTSSLTVTHDIVQCVNAVRDLEVTLDSELSMQDHVNKVAQTCFDRLRRLKQVQKLLGPDVSRLFHPSVTHWYPIQMNEDGITRSSL